MYCPSKHCSGLCSPPHGSGTMPRCENFSGTTSKGFDSASKLWLCQHSCAGRNRTSAEVWCSRPDGSDLLLLAYEGPTQYYTGGFIAVAGWCMSVISPVLPFKGPSWVNINFLNLINMAMQWFFYMLEDVSCAKYAVKTMIEHWAVPFCQLTGWDFLYHSPSSEFVSNMYN